MSTATRRRFLGLAGLAGAATVCGLPQRAAWAARGAAGDSLRLVFYTDVHARTEWQTPRAMAEAAAAINRERADLVVAGGDLITDGFQSAAATVEPRWRAYLEMHRAIEAPVAAVIGNHDLVAARPEDGSEPSPDPRSQFRTKLGVERTWRSVDAAGYRLFLLDSVEVSGDDLKYHGRISAEQLGWLRAELRRTDGDTPLVVATHLPLLTGFYQATEGATGAAPANRVVVNNREVLELFADHNLLLVLQGHLHVDEMLRWRSTTFITGGAVSGKWWRGSWHGTPEGFGVVTLRPDRVEWEYKSYGWVARRP
ncbi:MAG TPA: metallophosphoesterase [Candidatus Sulfomarinibacteraceae bacterium]|nr:metallophosphoesterase [Candidatus Sulfomarinibacteraceae bacterium]